MSGEIKINQAEAQKGIQEMSNALQALQKQIGETMDGNKDIRMSDAYNEIKQEYENLLGQFITLFQDNIAATETAVQELVELDQALGDNIALK
ncbi:YwqI/YxiC family protein [Terribacillus saccharophilus]|uniref:YwqI/YxiC family protein n=1 Tax=Terribacillus saccharophilus TaxID=361277 RepID=UPI00298A025A|nr:YwqI/YxiC family protein [Terribacillus saccharophilus]MCM3225711.1 YwqI/YxiC family protein [Terribacillus saccharophilus]